MDLVAALGQTVHFGGKSADGGQSTGLGILGWDSDEVGIPSDCNGCRLFVANIWGRKQRLPGPSRRHRRHCKSTKVLERAWASWSSSMYRPVISDV